MAKSTKPIEVYLEVGQKRTFAIVPEWPGWCRSGRDEEAALQSLFEYAPRYARVVQRSQLGFHTPSELSDLVVVEKLKGNATTDFGAPDITLPIDTEPVDEDEQKRWEKVLKACWRAFDQAVEEASGQTLRTGPRGGGRDLTKVVEHVRDVDIAYLKAMGGNAKGDKNDESSQSLAPLREIILTTLGAAVRGEIPARGPRGGLRWTPRYFVRRMAWHELDHTWEIEDRAK